MKYSANFRLHSSSRCFGSCFPLRDIFPQNIKQEELALTCSQKLASGYTLAKDHKGNAETTGKILNCVDYAF